MYQRGDFFRCKGKWCVILLAVISLATTAGCNPAMSKVYAPTEWRDMLKEAGDWVPLPFPESAFRPGSIIMVTETSIRWIDDLSSCRYPADILDPEKSRIPNISFNKAMEFGANAVVGYKGIAAEPGFSKVSKVNFEVLDHGVEYLRLIRFKDWINDPENKKKVSPSCMQELAKPNRYLVTEAFQASKAAYTLFDQSGAAMKLSLPLLKDLLKVSAGLKYSVDTNGKLVIEEPVYFAVRKAIRMGDDFEPRDPSGAKTSDAGIEALFFKSVPGGR
jgi:hypothetical protein